MACTSVTPGTIVLRDKDGRLGIVVSALPPYEDKELFSMNWCFRIVIDGIIVMTDRFGSNYTVVHAVNKK